MARNLISGRGVKHFMIAPMQGMTHTHTQIKKCPRLQFFDAQHVYLDPFTSGSNSTNQKLRLRYSIDSQFQMLQWESEKIRKNVADGQQPSSVQRIRDVSMCIEM